MGNKVKRNGARAKREVSLPANPPQSGPDAEDNRLPEEIINDGLDHRMSEELHRRVDQLIRTHPKRSRKFLMRQEIGRMKENTERLKREVPKFDPELLRQQQVAQLIKPFQRLRRKHPEVEPKMLAYYLSKPPDEQPLWLNSGMSV